MREVCVITDHKPLVAIVNKGMAMLSQILKCIMLRLHQCWVHIIYKPGLDLFIADWMSWSNHTENKEQEIAGMSINISAISTIVNMPACMSVEDRHAASLTK